MAQEKALIKIKIGSFFATRLPADLQSQLISGNSLVVEVEPGTSVEGLLRKLPWLGLGESFDSMLIVFVNGQQQYSNYVLQPEDVIDLHLPAAGG
ncbi:MAG: MoaD/ThiS family protein [Deltaproteobacteria bacterium]|nr:MAG: MoaD/ThiS family protein [Deltaproteobacteria bacterium]